MPLTRAGLALLVVLARHVGRVLSRVQLLDAALGRRAEPYDRSIDVLIGRLRRKIEPDPKVPRLILTVLGEEYKFAQSCAKARDRRSRQSTHQPMKGRKRGPDRSSAGSSPLSPVVSSDRPPLHLSWIRRTCVP